MAWEAQDLQREVFVSFVHAGGDGGGKPMMNSAAENRAVTGPPGGPADGGRGDGEKRDEFIMDLNLTNIVILRSFA